MTEEIRTEQAEPQSAAAPEQAPAAAQPEESGTGTAETAAVPPVANTGSPAPTASHAPYEGQQQTQRRGPGGGKRFPRRKVCAFCVDKIDYIDYKDTKRARKFMTERGKILPRRITGNCAAHQRMLTAAIKRARVVALVPYKAD